jgi:hypothetical protein
MAERATQRKNAAAMMKKLADDTKALQAKADIRAKATAEKANKDWQANYKKSKEDEAKFKADLTAAKTAITALNTQIAAASGQ